MFVQNYSESVRDPLLRECGGSQLALEQYLDFLVNRTFRQTLLVKAERVERIRYRLDPQQIGSMYFAGSYETNDKSALTLDGAEQICTSHGNRSVKLRNPVHKAVALVLSAQFPAVMTVEEIVAAVISRVPKPEEAVRTLVLGMIEELVILGGIMVRRERPAVADHVSSHPRVLDANRRMFASFGQSEGPAMACNQLHAPTTLSPLETFLLPLLDGVRSVDALESEVAAAARQNRLIFSRHGRPLDGKDVAPELVREELTLALEGLRRKGMLIA